MVFSVYSYHLDIMGNGNRDILFLSCQTWFGDTLVGKSIIQSLFPLSLRMLHWQGHLQATLEVSALSEKQDKSEIKFSGILKFVLKKFYFENNLYYAIILCHYATVTDSGANLSI